MKLLNRLSALFTAVMLAGIVMSIEGCSLLDLDGDGKFDPVAYLEGADISVGWVDQETGDVYTIALDELGHKIVGQWVKEKTGWTYELSKSGGISIIDDKGQVFTIQPKETE